MMTGAAYSDGLWCWMTVPRGRKERRLLWRGTSIPRAKRRQNLLLDVLRQARGGLPFGDTRDFEEQKKGLIAPTLSPQRLRETEFVTIQVGQVEEPLARAAPCPGDSRPRARSHEANRRRNG